MKVSDATIKIYYDMTVLMPDGKYREFCKEESGKWYERVYYDINSSLEPINQSFSDELDFLWQQYQRESEIPDNER